MLTRDRLLSLVDAPTIEAAIARAEARTSGEIRVSVAPWFWGNVQGTAERAFARLGMTATRERNGVLIYISAADRLVAVLGDKGINERVPEGFWDRTVELLKGQFAQGRFAEGLCDAVQHVADQLQHFFPRRTDDRDELSNEVSFGKR